MPGRFLTSSSSIARRYCCVRQSSSAISATSRPWRSRALRRILPTEFIYYLLSAFGPRTLARRYYNTSFREFVRQKESLSCRSRHRELESERTAPGVPGFPSPPDSQILRSIGRG